ACHCMIAGRGERKRRRVSEVGLGPFVEHDALPFFALVTNDATVVSRQLFEALVAREGFYSPQVTPIDVSLAGDDQNIRVRVHHRAGAVDYDVALADMGELFVEIALLDRHVGQHLLLDG
ncbi:MAG: hypothetical protein QG603_808, partial [Patescibacteria group bacterium]|nr:hypothetical protein [Patescibacteria group bacterium]